MKEKIGSVPGSVVLSVSTEESPAYLPETNRSGKQILGQVALSEIAIAGISKSDRNATEVFLGHYYAFSSRQQSKQNK